MKIKLTTKIWILIFCLLIAVIAINPLKGLEKGVLIKNVQGNSTAYAAGFMPGEIIKEINSVAIESLDDYSKAMSAIAVKPVKFSVIVKDSQANNLTTKTFDYASLTLDFVVDENLSIITVSANASDAGLTANMTVLAINGNKISSKEDFEKIKNRKRETKSKQQKQ